MTRHVYIVDDDESVRISLRALLGRTENLAIHSYSSGDAFLAARTEHASGVVLLDMHMPGASGLDVLRALKSIAVSFAAVVVTGQGDTGLAVQSMKAGAIDFVEKPYDHHDILKIIDEGFSRLEERSATETREREARDRIALLSPRERDVLDGLIEGRANKEIANAHGISPRTVEIYRANLMDKMGAATLSEALRIAYLAGLIAT